MIKVNNKLGKVKFLPIRPIQNMRSTTLKNCIHNQPALLGLKRHPTTHDHQISDNKNFVQTVVGACPLEQSQGSLQRYQVSTLDNFSIYTNIFQQPDKYTR